MKGICIILLVLYPVLSFAQEYNPSSYLPPDYNSYNLKGNVIRLKQTAALVPATATMLWFKESKTEIRGLDSLSELIINFDSSGIIQSKSETYLFSDVKKINRELETTYSYSNGMLLYKLTKEEDKISDSTIYDYDRRKRISSYLVFDNKNKPSFKYTFTYNSLQQLMTIRRKNEENFPVEMIKLKYDAAGNLAEQQFFDENMRKIKVMNFNEHRTDSTGMNNGTILVYDIDGNLSSGIMIVKDTLGLIQEKSIVDKEKKVTVYNTYHYNEKSEIEEEKIFANMENIIVTYKYKYDEHDNWVDKETYINNELFISAHRAIEYREF